MAKAPATNPDFDPLFDYDDTAERAAFSAPVHDVSKARDALIKRYQRAADAHASATPVRGRRPFGINNDHIELPLGFEHKGKSTLVRKSEAFGDAVKSLIERAKAGLYDEAIKLHLMSPKADDASSDGETVKSKRGGPRGPRGPLSPEALEARRAKVAARKAAA